MGSVAQAAIDGFNDFLRTHQATPGKARFTLVLFDDEYLVSANALPIQEVTTLNNDSFVPRGTTALLDAIGRTIDEIGARLAATAEKDRPGSVIIAIMTDGLENASTVFTWQTVSERIKHQRKNYNWEFLFLGANQDAIATAAQLHIAADNSASYAPTSKGTLSGSAAVRRKSMAMRRSAMGEVNDEIQADLNASMTDIVREEDERDAR